MIVNESSFDRNRQVVAERLPGGSARAQEVIKAGWLLLHFEAHYRRRSTGWLGVSRRFLLSPIASYVFLGTDVSDECASRV